MKDTKLSELPRGPVAITGLYKAGWGAVVLHFADGKTMVSWRDELLRPRLFYGNLTDEVIVEIVKISDGGIRFSDLRHEPITVLAEFNGATGEEVSDWGLAPWYEGRTWSVDHEERLVWLVEEENEPEAAHCYMDDEEVANYRTIIQDTATWYLKQLKQDKLSEGLEKAKTNPKAARVFLQEEIEKAQSFTEFLYVIGRFT